MFTWLSRLSFGCMVFYVLLLLMNYHGASLAEDAGEVGIWNCLGSCDECLVVDPDPLPANVRSNCPSRVAPHFCWYKCRCEDFVNRIQCVPRGLAN